MAFTNLEQTYYSDIVLEALRSNLQVQSLVNTLVFPNPQAPKATITKQSMENVDLNDYTSGGTITYQSMSGNSTQTYQLDQQKEFSVTFNSVDKITTNIDYMEKVISNGTYQLDYAIEQYIISTGQSGVHANNILGSASSPQTITSDNVITILGNLQRMLDVAKVPKSERRLLADPKLTQILATAYGLTMTAESAEQLNIDIGLLRDYRGTIFGFDVFETNAYTTTKSVPGTANDTVCLVNSAAISSSTTAIPYDTTGASTLTAQVSIGDYLVMKSATGSITAGTTFTALEAMEVSGTPTSSTVSVIRGQLGTTARVIPNNAKIYTLTYYQQLLAFHKNFIEFGVGLSEIESGRLDTKFADYVRGLFVYGGKVWTQHKPMGAKAYVNYDLS